MHSIEVRRDLARPHPRPEWFSGPVWIQEMKGATDSLGLEVLAVFFEAGARTLPHVHSTDQLLHFLEGAGVVGTQDGVRVFGPGGMAVIPAGEWHWHGATPETPTCHLSIRPGGPTRWAPEIPLHDWEAYMAKARRGG